MSFFSSDKPSAQSSQPEIPSSFLGVIRTMQDDIDGKPAERASVVHEENTAANPFSPDFVPSDDAPAFAPAPAAAPAVNPFAAPPAAAPDVTPGGIALEQPGKKALPANARKVMIGAAITLLAVTVLGVLAYFLLFWSRTPAEEPLPAAVPEVPAEEAAVPEPVVPVIPPFSADQPNYLPIDVEVATAETLRQSFAEAGTKIIGAGMSGPVEFLVTDKNNNPIAFSRFAFIAGLGLSSDLVALIEEPFSVFVYSDMGVARYGLSLSFKDAALAAERLTKEEAKIPAEWKPFLYGKEQPVPAQAVFRSGTYASQAVRFVNVDEVQNLSFDYAVRDKQWLIGSSKDTLRAIIDRAK